MPPPPALGSSSTSWWDVVPCWGCRGPQERPQVPKISWRRSPLQPHLPWWFRVTPSSIPGVGMWFELSNLCQLWLAAPHWLKMSPTHLWEGVCVLVWYRRQSLLSFCCPLCHLLGPSLGPGEPSVCMQSPTTCLFSLAMHSLSCSALRTSFLYPSWKQSKGRQAPTPTHISPKAMCLFCSFGYDSGAM